MAQLSPPDFLFNKTRREELDEEGWSEDTKSLQGAYDSPRPVGDKFAAASDSSAIYSQLVINRCEQLEGKLTSSNRPDDYSKKFND